jgi:hypothetical protein
VLEYPKPVFDQGEDMHVLWGILIVVAGLFLLISSSLRSEFIVYRLLVYRSKILWSEHVHRFHQIVGIIVIVVGVLVAIGYI